MAELPTQVHDQIERLCAEGDEAVQSHKYSLALDRYSTAWNLLPEPRIDWEAATCILAAMGDANFQAGDYLAARRILLTATTCPKAASNPLLHLRLGQCHFEMGDSIAAADELSKAYTVGGEEIFEGADKYWSFLKGRLKTPVGGWRR